MNKFDPTQYNSDYLQVKNDAGKLRVFLGGCAVYALFYTFCLYKNPSGITYPLFVLGSIIFFRLIVKHQFNNDSKTLPRACLFYEICLILLGVSVSSTDSQTMIFLDKLAILALMLCYFIRALFNTSGWSIIAHITAILNLIFGSLRYALSGFSDLCRYRSASRWLKAQQSDAVPKPKKLNRQLKSILIGIIIAIPVSLMLISLLRSADVIFDSIVSGFLDNIYINIYNCIKKSFSNIAGIIVMAVFAFLVSYAILKFLSYRLIKAHTADKSFHDPVTAVTFTSIIAFVYIVFCIIQIFGLFLGKLTLPEQYTYAEYARQGFFQLLFVCLINITLVLICLYYCHRSVPLMATLTAISVCTYIMTASSAMRMIMYIQAYRLTFLRIAVLFALAAIALIMSGVLIYLYNPGFELFRYCIAVVTSVFIIFSLSHPDYISASYNLSHIDRSSPRRSDITYILKLSEDAAPVYLSEEFRELCVNSGYSDTYSSYIDELKREKDSNPVSPRKFNLSRFIAFRKLD